MHCVKIRVILGIMAPPLPPRSHGGRSHGGRSHGGRGPPLFLPNILFVLGTVFRTIKILFVM